MRTHVRTLTKLSITTIICLSLASLSYAAWSDSINQAKKASSYSNGNNIPKVPTVPHTAQYSAQQTKSLEALKKVEKLKETLEKIDGLKANQFLGSFTVSLKNSTQYTTLTFAMTAILNKNDIRENDELFAEYKEEIIETVKNELATLTDKELEWEHEGRHILQAVTEQINTKAGKKIIKALVYGAFDLT